MTVIWLGEVGSDDRRQVGGKGASLGRLAAAGFPIPPGFVVTAEVYREVASQAWAALHCAASRWASTDGVPQTAVLGTLREAIRSAPLPPPFEVAVVEAYRRLSPAEEPVAVRSSATAEDLETASFAGQQETFLGVRGAADVLRRVRDCWASLYSDHAAAYRARQGVDDAGVAMAVVVQRLVDAEKAGVLFTAHPVTRRRDQVVVEACWGLGEALVSGLVAPDHFVLSKGSGRILESYVLPKRQMIVRNADGSGTRTVTVPAELERAPVLGQGELAALLDLGRRLEAFFGLPQDAEWVIAGGALYLLQSRPITTL